MARFRRDDERQKAPASLGDVLADSRKYALERSRAPMDRYSYRLAVGRRIAERTELGPLRRGELTVYVASPAWAQELSLLAPEMLSRLKERGLAVERLKFRLSTKPQQNRAEPQAKKPPLPRALPPELDARLSKLTDDELRSAIAEAAGLAFGRALERERRAKTISKPPAARGPRAAASRSAPPDQSSGRSLSGSRDTRAKRRG